MGVLRMGLQPVRKICQSSFLMMSKLRMMTWRKHIRLMCMALSLTSAIHQARYRDILFETCTVSEQRTRLYSDFLVESVLLQQESQGILPDSTQEACLISALFFSLASSMQAFDMLIMAR